ncbi:MAG: hypothetical protein ACLFVZ_12275 [Actinomycetota bacterium]
MAKEIELRRHTDNDGDVLTAAGVANAVEIGTGLRGGYRLAVASTATRAVQTVACFLAGLGETVSDGAIIEPGLRSSREDEWRDAYSRAGSGDLDSLRQADPDLVRDDSARLANGLRSIFARLDDGDRALAVGHSPTSEAAVYGLTGETIDPLDKGEGVIVAEADGRYSLVIRLEA